MRRDEQSQYGLTDFLHSIKQICHTQTLFLHIVVAAKVKEKRWNLLCQITIRDETEVVWVQDDRGQQMCCRLIFWLDKGGQRNSTTCMCNPFYYPTWIQVQHVAWVNFILHHYPST